MRKNRQMIKLFCVLLFCTAFIFSSSHFGAQAFERITKDVEKDTTAATSRPLKSGKSIKNHSNNSEHLAVENGVDEIILNQSTVKMKDIPMDLQTVLKHVSKLEIPEQSTFSLLKFVKKQKIANISSDTLSLLSSGIYQAILPTNFLIVERNIGNSLPDYVNLGFEAKLDLEQNVDFAFSNPNKVKYSIELKLVDKSLNVSLKGEKFPYLYKISLKNKQSFKPRTIIQYSPLILPGKVKVATDGAEGQMIEVYRDVYQGDQQLKSELISEDYYPPVHRVEIHSLSDTSNDQGSHPSTETVTQEGGQAKDQSKTGTVISSNNGQNSNTSETPAKNSEVGQTNEGSK